MSTSQSKRARLEDVEMIMRGDSYEGFCTNCGEWTHDCCEPDARNYKCPVCGEMTVYGAEELLVEGLVD